jgi:hypothetical protein
MHVGFNNPNVSYNIGGTNIQVNIDKKDLGLGIRAYRYKRFQSSQAMHKSRKLK